MKLFKLMLIAAAIAVSVPAVAQDLSFGVKAGLNFSNFKVDADGYSVSPKSIAGINLGVYADYNFSDLLALESGLTFEQKGCKVDEHGYKSTDKINYLTLPINLRANIAVGDNNLYFLAGPTFGIGLSGKWEEEDDGDKDDGSIKFGTGEDDDYKRMNVGFLIGAGFELPNNLGVRLTYDLGISNIDSDGKSEYKVKANAFGIAVTYKF